MADKMHFFTMSYVAQTDYALLLCPETWDEEDAVWLPKSQLDWDADTELGELERGDYLEVWVPQWLCDKNDLDY